MDHGWMRICAAVGLSAICGCAALGIQEKPAPVERLDEHGVSARTLLVEARSVLRFVNADARPHQIYSSDCAELSSTVLSPGETFAAAIGSGAKVCHFQDLLAPLAAGYSGTVQVHDAEAERRLETMD